MNNHTKNNIARRGNLNQNPIIISKYNRKFQCLDMQREQHTPSIIREDLPKLAKNPNADIKQYPGKTIYDMTTI